MIERYPCPYSCTALMVVMGSIQSTVFALCVEKNAWSRWKLEFNIRLLAVVFSVRITFSLCFKLNVFF